MVQMSVRSLLRRALLLGALVAVLASLVPAQVYAAGSDMAMGAATHATGRNWRNDRPNENNWDGHHSNWDKGDPWNTHKPNRPQNRCETSYKVRKGDTLSEIAQHFHVSVRQLMKANNIQNPHRIIAGTTLCIP